MSRTLNKVILIGNAGQDPDIRSTGESVVANFSLATSSSQKDAEGNWQEHTEWHHLVAFKRTAEIARDYVKKGSRICVEGKIRTREWEDRETGAKRYHTEIVVSDLILLGDKEAPTTAEEPRAATPAPASGYPARKPSFPPMDDDDIPF